MVYVETREVLEGSGAGEQTGAAPKIEPIVTHLNYDNKILLNHIKLDLKKFKNMTYSWNVTLSKLIYKFD